LIKKNASKIVSAVILLLNGFMELKTHQCHN
jgi:hypothetical protein